MYVVYVSIRNFMPELCQLLSCCIKVSLQYINVFENYLTYTVYLREMLVKINERMIE